MAAAFCSEAERLAAMEEDAKQQDAPDAIDGNDPVLRAALLETGGECKPDHDFKPASSRSRLHCCAVSAP
jgi:hypothetical protein